MSEELNREECPHCGSEKTEFVQFASGEENTVQTDPEEVGDGLLELRSCDNCRNGIELILEPASYQMNIYDN